MIIMAGPWWLSAGGNPRGVFGLALVQGEWKVYVSGLLDREQQDWYLLNITASDGLFVARSAVEVTVMDANDNSPICNQVRWAVARVGQWGMGCTRPLVMSLMGQFGKV